MYFYNKNQKLNFCWYTDNGKENITYMCQSINTLLKFNVINRIYIVYIADTDDQQQLDTEVQSLYNTINSLSFIYNCDDVVIKCVTHYKEAIDKNFPELPNTTNGRLRYYSLLRFLIGHVPEIEDEIIWYCDTDILFNGKIDDMFRSIQHKNKDLLMYFFNRKDYHGETQPQTYEHTSYLNAGIHMINIRLWKELGCINILIDFYNRYYNFVKYVNQTGFQFISTLFPSLVDVCIADEYNTRPSYGFPYEKIKIMHFNGEINKKAIQSYYDEIMHL